MQRNIFLKNEKKSKNSFADSPDQGKSNGVFFVGFKKNFFP